MEFDVATQFVVRRCWNSISANVPTSRCEPKVAHVCRHHKWRLGPLGSAESVATTVTTGTGDASVLSDDDVLKSNQKREEQEQAQVEQNEQEKSLMKMSLITAMAIALHNFPEGLATFVATVADESLGVSIAVAIAIHNIPEGISVSMPIYFATGSKWKAFMWSFISGVAEPIGGLIGYLIIDSMFGDAVYGVLFSFTAGIMIYISFKELLPMARKKDDQDKYTTMLVFAGFLVMDMSLILFKI